MILSEQLARELRERHKKLDSQGDLFSKSQLSQWYDNFRQRFGPDKLSGLDGEVLLETIHNQSNRDSLVYWLEFKNDDELSTLLFGSIAGGSALKFGIYKRKETGAWMAGSPVNQKELSTEEAIEIARKHRNQLIAGVELLEKIPINGTDSDYNELQKSMNELVPDVSDSAWGHKYFHMLFPDKLDDYHSADYQRFNLIKLLQMPPKGDGRYICAGRYIAVANELDMNIHILTAILNHRNGRPHRYWRVGTKLGGVDSRWELMRENKCVAIGWAKLPNMSEITYNKESKEIIRTFLTDNYPEKNPPLIGRQTQQIFNFTAVIREGDIVVPSDGQNVLGIGKIAGEYFYEPNSDAPHRRPVEWFSLGEWKMPDREGLRTTVFPIKKEVNLVEIEKRLFDTPIEPPPLKTLLEGTLGRIQSILERKGQVILYGPPGTGKTYWAEKAARDLAAYGRFEKAFDQLSDDQKEVITGRANESAGLVQMCTFHPAYGYEDFLEGYRPQTVDKQLVFEQHDGIFKKVCDDAKDNRMSKYYLIIDEINRGDIPRIFGELLTVLEKDKRGKSIFLAISGERFFVPDNVNIIGTMNTADRSIALLDTALRRRFGFIELMPDSDVLGDTVIESIPLAPWLEALNNNICQHIGRDARNLQIGHAYLLDKGKPVKDFKKFSRILQDDIFPLLEEYCYEDYSTLAKILGKSLVDENRQMICKDLFDPAKEDDLIQALKAIDPNIDTSRQALTSAAETLDQDESDDEAEDNESSEQ